MKLLAFIFEQPSYDQEIPQSQTADNPMTPRGRATQHSFSDHLVKEERAGCINCDVVSVFCV